MADYFDRLLARYAPGSAAGGAGGAVRVRPRLPGPYERPEAVRTGLPEPDEPAALIPAAPRPAFGPVESVRLEREVRTDRHTVVRTESARPGEAGPPTVAPPPTAGPVLRPAATVVPGPRPSAAEGPRAAGRTPVPPVSGPVRAPGAGSVPRAPIAPATDAPVRARPRDADTVVARGAAANGVGRRASRTPERVVHVQIGRLEVSAATAPGASVRTPAGRTGRAAPALTLDAYLARGETRN
ncbi:hypothetical protein KQY30_32950 [Streptomyces sp. GMY02]|uniref:hypothetical protein n=1 Tax=Streptomyces sp. GMY02 TaxID=1333528 RepID=UPI001C2C06C5|nr:hypothetical protein [Streptomyces sp. GMY02]QXE38331.1 hypothetical protein KQY30_32950 [Streptomyces sp. GMY02]